jgi:polyhydroxybutyrate depolymerase
MSSQALPLFALLAAIAAGCSGASSTPSQSVGSTGVNASTGSSNGSTGTNAGAAGDTSGSPTSGATSGAVAETGSTGPTSGTTEGSAGSSGSGTGVTSGSNGSGASGSAGASGVMASMSGSASGGDGGGLATMMTDGGRPSGMSAGCGQSPPSTEAIGMATLQMIDITGLAPAYVSGFTHRKYCTTIPKGYSPNTAYPVVFYGPGCGATTCEGSSFTGRTDIFYVEAISTTGCFQTGRTSTVDSPELNYFDQVMAHVQATYCTDKGKVFAAGTSSGGWLSNYLGCARGNVIRGIAADSGGIPFAHPPCTGGAAAMEFPGDSANTTDPQGNQIGLSVARDLFIKTNGCSSTPTNMMFGKASCQYYGGCSSPVVWCDTGGAHQAGNNYLSPSGWAFWSTLQ